MLYTNSPTNLLRTLYTSPTLFSVHSVTQNSFGLMSQQSFCWIERHKDAINVSGHMTYSAPVSCTQRSYSYGNIHKQTWSRSFHRGSVNPHVIKGDLTCKGNNGWSERKINGYCYVYVNNREIWWNCRDNYFYFVWNVFWSKNIETGKSGQIAFQFKRTLRVKRIHYIMPGEWAKEAVNNIKEFSRTSIPIAHPQDRPLISDQWGSDFRHLHWSADW